MKLTNCSIFIKTAGLFAFIAVLSSAYVTAGHHGEKESKISQMDIVDTAMGAEGFSTLITAVKAAGLVDALKGEGPYTLFAPTDKAFSKIPQSQLQALLNDKKALTAVLTYHVIPARVPSKQVLNLSSAKTLHGQSVSIDTNNGVRIDNANVIKADIMASNGVIHAIDEVILPN